MPTASGLPPVVSDSVFAVSTSTIIDAPREKVWTVLMDFPSYNQWYVVPFDSSPSIDCPQLVPQESIRVCHYLANHRELITLEKKKTADARPKLTALGILYKTKHPSKETPSSYHPSMSHQQWVNPLA